MGMNLSKELTWDSQTLQNVIRKLFYPKSLVFLCAVKELTVWKGYGNCVVIIATATSPKSAGNFGTISLCLENISVGIACGMLRLNMC